ncbi:hypothetical protein MUK42_13207 [Musa troglodytarum]|uniref:Uncharacterized protein n=1 Tax=Musa troglodytarum TaxID=320322 RepID=A0A9E7H0B6_9LILI|nr:hypothetical protein MUK42_13207 [Musa troglodytarum]
MRSRPSSTWLSTRLIVLPSSMVKDRWRGVVEDATTSKGKHYGIPPLFALVAKDGRRGVEAIVRAMIDDNNGVSMRGRAKQRRY